MLRIVRFVAGAVAALLIIAALLALDARAWHVVPRLRFGHLTPIAQAQFARRGSDLARSTEPRAREAAAIYAAAAHSASVMWGAKIGRDTVVVNYSTTMRWCPMVDEPNLIQVMFVSEPDGWRVIRAGPFPC